MNCPSCGNKMEGASSNEVTFSPGPGRPESLKACPTAIYRCEECDAEYAWRLGVRGLRLLDGGREVMREHERDGW